ncbi:MAG: hypothetical protein H0T65_13845, partial [Deltaproteobacteria bacterium]|nr:hypothetical protein [Deltaproteobacteria bacterium]
MQGPTKIFAFVVLLSISACGGGGGETRAKPLKSRYDDALLVQVAADQRAAADAARATWNKAKDEHLKAEADFNEVNAQMSVVKNDKKAADLKLDSAKSMKKTSDGTNDANKMNAAQKELRSAELGKKAAEARVKYYETYRNFLKKQKNFTEEQMYWRESQYELAKSQVGQANAIRPPNVNYAEFGPQEAERAKRAEKARDSAVSDKSKAANAREDWLKKQAEADQHAGARSAFPDPMLSHQNQNT